MKRFRPLFMDLAILAFLVGTPVSVYLAGQRVSTTIQREMDQSRKELQGQIDSLATSVFGEELTRNRNSE